jgi:UDP:flavonoid glycosyltransferase YjiC (YdhE family)
MRRDITEDVHDGNLVYRPFSEKGFIDDLRTARAVIAGGGYTLMSEAVYLRKPVLSLPVQGQFEQVLNALYLEKLGYGMYAPELTLERLRDFLQRVPRCQEALQGYVQDGNKLMIEALREQLARAAEYKGRWWEEFDQAETTKA